jgi:hypothetical protein
VTVVKHKIDIVAFYTLESSDVGFNLKATLKAWSPDLPSEIRELRDLRSLPDRRSSGYRGTSVEVTVLVPTDLDSCG